MELRIDSALIDPTDCVDLPPLSSDAFLDPHAAALNRMAMEGGIGASVLADQLPPHSPGMWSFDSEEEAWRKGAPPGSRRSFAKQHAPSVRRTRRPPATVLFGTLNWTSQGVPLRASLHPTATGRPLVVSGAQTPASLAGGSAQASGSDVRPVASAPGVPNPLMSPSGLSVPRRKRELGQRILSRMIDEDEINSIDPTTVEHDSDDELEMPQAIRGQRVTSDG